MVRPSTPKHRSYLAELIYRAWKEVGFIEVLSEAIGGFVLASFAHYKGWIDQDGVFEMLLDYVGCAVLIPFVAFILRMFFAAPAELVKESMEDKRKCEINPKSIYPSIIAILLAICSFLSVGLIFSLKFNFSHHSESPNSAHEETKAQPKRLPDKIIPQPVTSNAVPMISPPQDANAQSPIQFETNNPDSDVDEQSYINKVKSDQAAQMEAAKKNDENNTLNMWAKNLPAFNYLLEALHRQLDKKIQNQDEISKTLTYYQCLPQKIGLISNELNVAEIKLLTNTNLDFTIRITPTDGSGGGLQPNGIKISSSCGFVEFRPTWVSSGNFLHRIIHIPNFDNDIMNVGLPPDQTQNFIKEGVGVLVDAQYKSSTYNKSVTNIVDNPK
jgi:hypothetical protein